MTIGKTTRGAIERAYDWTIPIISDMPDTISRLHSSASCVLLLRAYSTEGDERAQLKELSAPLLRHVTESLTGRFGASDAEKAFDLLMSDVASRNPDRRRCARRVLFDAIGKLNKSDGDEVKQSSWMLNILQLDHSKSLVADGIKHMVSKEIVMTNEPAGPTQISDQIPFSSQFGVVHSNWIRTGYGIAEPFDYVMRIDSLYEKK